MGSQETAGSLRVALVQRAATLDPEANRAAVSAAGDAVPPGTALVVFPEVFQRDFGPADQPPAGAAEPLGGAFVSHLAGFAADHGTTVVAGMFEVSDDPRRPFNTLVVVDADGLRASYRKIHLYDSFGYRESDRLRAGAVEPVVVDVAGFRLGLMTCYDLRFPELARLLVGRGAEVLVVPAAWVAGPRKADHWRTLVLARAIENTAYVVAAGQPGPRYTGHSLVVGPAGEVLAEAGDGDHVLTAELSRPHLDEVRRENPSLANRRL